MGDLVDGKAVGFRVGERVGTGALVGFLVEGRGDTPVLGLAVAGLPVGLVVGRRVEGGGVGIDVVGARVVGVRVVGIVERSQCAHPV